MPHITLAKLPLENLKRKPFRTSALVIVVMMLTVAFYGGALLSMNLNNGLNSMRNVWEPTPWSRRRIPAPNQAEALLTVNGVEHVLFHQ